MTARIILQVFDQYQKARAHFVSTVADLASRPTNIECLMSAGVLDLLKPLLSDIVPSIQQGACVAIGRLANHDEKIADSVARKDLLPALLKGLDKQNKYYKKSALFILRAIAKHSAEMAEVVIQAGGLDAMIICLEDFDQGVKESAAWGIGYIARHSAQQARCVVDAGAVPLLVLCLQEPDLCVKQVAVSALSDIAKHSLDLATTVTDAGAIPFLAKYISNPDAKLKRQVLVCLSQLAKHSVDLAELVVEAEVFPEVLVHLAHPDDEVKRNAAAITREVTKHTMELAQLVVNTGGLGALIEMISKTSGTLRLPAVMSLGYICAHNDQLALAVINANAIPVLTDVLNEESEDHILAACIWTLGQCGKHSPEHAQYLGQCEAFQRILQLYTCERSSEDLKQKCKTTLKQVLQKTLHIPALEPLLYDGPPNILKYVLGQFSKILPNDPKARRMFVESGALKKVQELEAEPGSSLMEYITIINCCFPEEVVRFYSPGYPDALLEKVEQYQPQIPPLLMSSRHSSEEDALQHVVEVPDEGENHPNPDNNMIPTN